MKTTLDLRERPLPAAVSAVDTDEYQKVVIDTEAVEHDEELVDLATFGIKTASFYGDKTGLNAPVNRPFRSGLTNVYARTSVAKMLVEVNKLLAEYGVAVVVIDGYRPISVQTELWFWMVEQAQKQLPNGTEADWHAFALRYASNPGNFKSSDSSTWPTHATGGAVDLSLEEIGTGKPLFMGSIYLDSTELSSTRHFESASDCGSASHVEAKWNRRLLYWAMSSVGFVNYPFEWWHFDYLTQASVMNRGFPEGAVAHYGLALEGESPEA
ncbi:MAG TPA: M15 family metallopeptidase [Drouetiella sp.]